MAAQGRPLRGVPMVEIEQVPDTEEAARAEQAELEGAASEKVVHCLGGTYKVAEKVGLMPLLRFAHAAKQGLDTADMDGLAAVYDMLHDCLDPADWDRFAADMTREKAGADDLLPLVTQAIEVLSARPTGAPSGSSDGSPATTATSTAGSPPRPDVAGLVPVSELLGSRA